MTTTLAWVLAALLASQDGGGAVTRLQKRLHEAIDRSKPAFVFVGGGSGVCISPDGWILTNHHVAGGRRTWSVRFSGGREATADLVGWHPLDDVALLKVRDGKDLPFARLGDSDRVRVGDRVFALGNPFMLGSESWEPSVAFGIVSARDIYLDNPGYKAAIQTDAQINPGNSGGPLVTLDGEVIGINGRIDIRRFQNRVNTGVGYAIPSTQIARFLPHLMAGGRQWGGFLEGVTIGECGDDRYERTGAYGDGVFLAGLEEGCPTERAGLRLGDILFEIAGRRIVNANRFHGVVGSYPAGSVVPVRYRRWDAGRSAFEEGATKVLLGSSEQLKECHAQAGSRYYGFVPDYAFEGEGFKVAAVNPGGPGEKAGLKPGDVLERAGGEPIPSWVEFRRRMGALSPGAVVKLSVRRNGEVVETELTLARRDLEQDRLGEEVPPEEEREEPEE